MGTQMTKALDALDPDDLRNSTLAMRDAVASVASAGRECWRSEWADLAELLAEVGSVDLCLARLVEGHADAMRILDQAHAEVHDGVYGVWASRSAGTGLRAEKHSDEWTLAGELRFASGIDLIDRALAPGWIDAGRHLLFDVPADAFDADRDSWNTNAMDASRSFTCRCDALPAGEPVGPENFYLGRPGFAVGGLGPAAVWLGGARGIERMVAEGLVTMGANAHQLRRMGAITEAVWQAGAAVAQAARVADRGSARDAAIEIGHARTSVALACDLALRESAVIVGPGGLSRHRRLVRTRDDLGIYVRQHHLDPSLEVAGRATVEAIGAHGA